MQRVARVCQRQLSYLSVTSWAVLVMFRVHLFVDLEPYSKLIMMKSCFLIGSLYLSHVAYKSCAKTSSLFLCRNHTKEDSFYLRSSGYYEIVCISSVSDG